MDLVNLGFRILVYFSSSKIIIELSGDFRDFLLQFSDKSFWSLSSFFSYFSLKIPEQIMKSVLFFIILLVAIKYSFRKSLNL